MRNEHLDTVLRCGIAVAISWLGLASRCHAQTWGDPVWSDEFNATVAGTPPDATKWVYDFGAGKWGNRELETYCQPGMEAPCQAGKPNAFQDGKGNLVIQALRTSADPAPTGTWTSGRLKTMGIQDFQYGRLEACMRLPTGAGLWPAFWLLGTVGPGFSGEMDIMENVPKSGQPGGLGPTVVETTIHGALGTGRRLFSLGADVTLPNGGRVDDTACHVYGEIWSPFMIQMYVDDWRSPYFIRTANDVPTDGRWVFNDPNRFYFLLNVAVGGGWPGPPDATTPSPATMLVDYVRVYKAAQVKGPEMTAAPLHVKTSTAGSATLALRATRETGLVYLACAGGTLNMPCTIDSGNPLNPSVVDFSGGESQTAKITLTAPSGAKSAGLDLNGIRLAITAYTVSGDQSTVTIPVTIE
jgi:beta-glucanase (GH16 family)